MRSPCIYKELDFDYEVIDIFLFVDDEEFHLRSFDDHEWKEAEEFAEKMAKLLSLKYLGDMTNT